MGMLFDLILISTSISNSKNCSHRLLFTISLRLIAGAAAGLLRQFVLYLGTELTEVVQVCLPIYFHDGHMTHTTQINNGLVRPRGTVAQINGISL